MIRSNGLAPIIIPGTKPVDPTGKTDSYMNEYHQKQLDAMGSFESAISGMSGLISEAKLERDKVSPERLAAMFGRDAVSAHDSATDAGRRNMARYGMNPASGAWAGMENSRALARAAIDAGARNRGRVQGLEMGFNMLNTISGMQSNMARGYGDLASMWGDFAAGKANADNLGGANGGFIGSVHLGGGSTRRVGGGARPVTGLEAWPTPTAKTNAAHNQMFNARPTPAPRSPTFDQLLGSLSTLFRPVAKASPTLNTLGTGVRGAMDTFGAFSSLTKSFIR